MKPVYGAMVWQALHLALGVVLAANEQGNPTPPVHELLAYSLWNLAPYGALWLLALPREHRRNHLHLIHGASLVFFAVYAITSLVGQKTGVSPFHWASIGPFFQWPATLAVLWLATYIRTPTPPQPDTADKTPSLWARYKNSKSFLWAPLAQALCYLPFLGKPSDEYFTLFLVIAVFGLSVFLPLTLFEFAGRHLPGSRAVANIGNSALLLLPAGYLATGRLTDAQDGTLWFLIGIPLTQGFIALITTLTAYIILKTRANHPMDRLYQ
ncbi:hypothetical protein [Acanthopleuribacter pedis]|uniref:Uncharacterized protein n=1 Tax=Acanthopleuribacter pedis TaxID=442870 RepID=A0A8J7QPG6_9BACT|nr:hypothetical protein [Acanthopleuribacter pedis]MBO1322745.1 hypothetical protein [Acanthopleuribacter pedis]